MNMTFSTSLVYALTSPAEHDGAQLFLCQNAYVKSYTMPEKFKGKLQGKEISQMAE